MNQKEVELLCKGLSFCPTPPPNIPELTNDIFQFTRQLRLIYHFRDSTYVDNSIVRLPSAFTPAPNANTQLERIIHGIEHIPVSRRKVKSNIHKYRHHMDSIKRKIDNGQLILKPADKGDIITIMTPDFYCKMCMDELNKSDFYQNVGHIDPSEQVFQTVKDFALRYKNMLSENEFKFLMERKYKMAYFYSLPKLHKSEVINNILRNSASPYIQIKDFDNKIDGRPIVGGPTYFTSGLSEMVDILLKPVVKFIPYLLKDSFDLLEKLNPEATEEILLGSCDIKSLYTNISHDLAYKSIDYWLTLTEDFIDSNNRFSKQFILEALKIILECNYFYFNTFYWHQILGFAMGTKAAVQCANLIVAYLEEKMFILLPTVYPHDFVAFIIFNYFRFLDDIFLKWLKGFDIQHLYTIFDGLDPQLKFIFSELSKGVDFLDISFSIENDILNTSVYHKPTDSFNYLQYESCHPTHTKNNIAISLARRIIRIANTNRDKKLEELKQHLERRGHPSSVINYAFSKLYSPGPEPPKKMVIFKSTHNPTHVYSTNKIRKCLDNVQGQNQNMQKAFKDYKVVQSSRQPKSLRSMLVKSKFDLVSTPIAIRSHVVGLFVCGSCIYCEEGFINSCNSFRFGKNDMYEWVYTRHFTCDSVNVVYLAKCNFCWNFYIGQSSSLTSRTCKHKSDVYHPENSNCKICSKHFRNCSRFVIPFFKIYPLLYEDDKPKRLFLEKRLILKYKPSLNSDT